jgi:hypothetical protein
MPLLGCISKDGMPMMPMKNYTTKVPATRSIEAIQTALVKHGATGMLYEYEPGTGRIAALRFRLPLHERTVSFALPVNWRQLQRVEGVPKVLIPC